MSHDIHVTQADLIDAVTLAAVRRQYPNGGLVKHVQVSRNYGRLGGWLRCEFLAHEGGDATGQSASRVEYPHV